MQPTKRKFQRREKRHVTHKAKHLERASKQNATNEQYRNSAINASQKVPQ